MYCSKTLSTHCVYTVFHCMPLSIQYFIFNLINRWKKHSGYKVIFFQMLFCAHTSGLGFSKASSDVGQPGAFFACNNINWLVAVGLPENRNPCGIFFFTGLKGVL